MPINRPDGRHWCAPDQEIPDEDGQWTCPDCGTVWLFSETEMGSLWETPEDRELRQNATQVSETVTEEEADGGR